MEKKSVYDFFIGLLALMLALMFVIDIFIDIPNEVSWTFYYIDNIVRLIFIGDYVTRLVISKSKRNFIKKKKELPNFMLRSSLSFNYFAISVTNFLVIC